MSVVYTGVDYGHFDSGAFVVGVNEFCVYAVNTPGQGLLKCMHPLVEFNMGNFRVGSQSGKAGDRYLGGNCGSYPIGVGDPASKTTHQIGIGHTPETYEHLTLGISSGKSWPHHRQTEEQREG
ncbi:MAG: hypothetical protein QMD08_04055 [Actinomycetota bacterium]|nr:hypothetical protein [Actinomycetota bacterium]